MMEIMIKRNEREHSTTSEEFSWLSYTSGNDTMYVGSLQDYPNQSALVLGSNKFRKDPLYKHEKSTCHIACINQQCYLDSKGNPVSVTWKLF